MKTKLRKVERGLFSVDIYESQWEKFISPVTKKEPAWIRANADVNVKIVRPGLFEVHLDGESKDPCKKVKKP